MRALDLSRQAGGRCPLNKLEPADAGRLRPRYHLLAGECRYVESGQRTRRQSDPLPFAARTYHDGQINRWKAPDGEIRPMPRHGFARDGFFELTQTTDYGFTAELRPRPEDAEAYPFDYRFSVRYEFSDISLRAYLTLENLGDQPIPWSAGHHFYFTVPWHAGLSRSDYGLEIPARKCYTHGPDGKLLPEEKGWEMPTYFDSPNISDRIYTKLKSGLATFDRAAVKKKSAFACSTQQKPTPHGTHLSSGRNARIAPSIA